VAAIQVLAETVDLLARLAEAQELTERIEAIATDAATVRRQVEQLTAEAASDLAGQEAEASAATLIARHQQARIDEQARDKLRQQHERQQAAEKTARATIDKLTARLTAMCQEAGCQRPEELPEAERASEAASRLDESLRALDAQLLGLSAGAGIEALIAEAQGQSADELPANLERLQLQIQECGTERDALQHAIGVEETKLGAMRSGAEAADAAEEVQELLAELETDVPQYVRLRLASAVLREGIERYRRKNEGPVLRRASELFAQLTLGSFERLSADCDERGQQVLKGVRPGGAGTVELAGMSEGTSDQLYLALRLASLESYLEGRAPVPFIVDDVLVSFDDGRASAALGALADLSRRTQVIFFTHHAHLVDLARKGLAADTLFVHEL
jgi:uncharacterized protein YhaN